MLLKVVIVEDEEIIRKGLLLAINWLDMGCIIVGSARDGVEGLNLIRKEKPDVVLTDIRMPKLTGLEMIERASEFASFYSIVLTSYSEFELAKKALHIGVTDYLLKPIDEEELSEVVGRIHELVEKKEKIQTIERLSEEYVLGEGKEWRIFKLAQNDVDVYVRKTYELIKEHYCQRISINTVAEELGVSASYLSRKLKKSLNTSFVDLLNQYRISQSIVLLGKGTMRIYEISDQLGFSEYKHFCSVFKKYTNSSPTEFLKSGSALALNEGFGKKLLGQSGNINFCPECPK